MFRTKPGEGRALIEDWINRPSLRKLVEAFDGTWPDSASTGARSTFAS